MRSRIFSNWVTTLLENWHLRPAIHQVSKIILRSWSWRPTLPARTLLQRLACRLWGDSFSRATRWQQLTCRCAWSAKMTVCQGSWPMQSVPRAMRTSADALAELKWPASLNHPMHSLTSSTTWVRKISSDMCVGKSARREIKSLWASKPIQFGSQTVQDWSGRLRFPKLWKLMQIQIWSSGYNVFEKWSQTMMEAYGMLPLEGHVRATVEQLHRADLQLFKVMMRETRGGIKPLGGVRPVKQALLKAMHAAEVRLCLQPLQGSSKPKADPLDSGGRCEEGEELSWCCQTSKDHRKPPGTGEEHAFQLLGASERLKRLWQRQDKPDSLATAVDWHGSHQSPRRTSMLWF